MLVYFIVYRILYILNKERFKVNLNKIKVIIGIFINYYFRFLLYDRNRSNLKSLLSCLL